MALHPQIIPKCSLYPAVKIHECISIFQIKEHVSTLMINLHLVSCVIIELYTAVEFIFLEIDLHNLNMPEGSENC